MLKLRGSACPWGTNPFCEWSICGNGFRCMHRRWLTHRRTEIFLSGPCPLPLHFTEICVHMWSKTLTMGGMGRRKHIRTEMMSRSATHGKCLRGCIIKHRKHHRTPSAGSCWNFSLPLIMFRHRTTDCPLKVRWTTNKPWAVNVCTSKGVTRWYTCIPTVTVLLCRWLLNCSNAILQRLWRLQQCLTGSVRFAAVSTRTFWWQYQTARSFSTTKKGGCILFATYWSSSFGTEKPMRECCRGQMLSASQYGIVSLFLQQWTPFWSTPFEPSTRSRWPLVCIYRWGDFQKNVHRLCGSQCAFCTFWNHFTHFPSFFRRQKA